MIFWLSVLFLCNDKCEFLQGDTKFFSHEQCVAVTNEAIKQLGNKETQVAGTCIKVNLKDLV